MSEITISTSSLRRTRQARIDGALYEVRELGAGDQLDISQISSKLSKESREMMNLKAKADVVSQDDDKAQADLLDEMNIAMDRVSKLQAELEKCYVKLFVAKDDKGDAKELVHSVGIDGVSKLLKQVFGEKLED